MVSAVALAAARSAALALTFLAVRSGYARLRGRQGLGLGDVKLAGVAGTWLDWSMMPIAVELAAVAALSFYLFRVGVLGRPSAALRLVLRAGRLAVLGFSKFHLNRQARSRDQQTEADSAAFERPPAAVFVPDGTSIALMKGIMGDRCKPIRRFATANAFPPRAITICDTLRLHSRNSCDSGSKVGELNSQSRTRHVSFAMVKPPPEMFEGCR